MFGKFFKSFVYHKHIFMKYIAILKFESISLKNKNTVIGCYILFRRV